MQPYVVNAQPGGGAQPRGGSLPSSIPAISIPSTCDSNPTPSRRIPCPQILASWEHQSQPHPDAKSLDCLPHLPVLGPWQEPPPPRRRMARGGCRASPDQGARNASAAPGQLPGRTEGPGTRQSLLEGGGRGRCPGMPPSQLQGAVDKGGATCRLWGLAFTACPTEEGQGPTVWEAVGQAGVGRGALGRGGQGGGGSRCHQFVPRVATMIGPPSANISDKGRWANICRESRRSEQAPPHSGRTEDGAGGRGKGKKKRAGGEWAGGGSRGGVGRKRLPGGPEVGHREPGMELQEWSLGGQGRAWG